MRRKELIKDLAKQRFYALVDVAFKLAREGKVELASEVGKQAFKVAKKGGYRVPRKVKRRFCRRCYVPLIPGVTARVRIKNKGYPTVVVTCLNCGYIRRYPGKHEGPKGRAEPDEAHGTHREERGHGRSDKGNKETTLRKRLREGKDGEERDKVLGAGQEGSGQRGS